MAGLGALGQTVQVVDRSGKVVSTSRHLFNVFKIGRDAYNERKREVNAKKAEEAAMRAVKRPNRAYTMDELGSVHSGRSHRSRRGQSRSHYPIEAPRSPEALDHAGEPLYRVPFNETHPEHFPGMPPRRHSEFLHRPGPPPQMYSEPPHQYGPSIPPQPQWTNPQPGHEPGPFQPQPTSPMHPQQYGNPTLVRRNTTRPEDLARRGKSPNSNSNSNPDGIDMDLAYGDLPPDFLYPGSPSVASSPAQDEAQLNGLIGKANVLLEEANCLRSGATATITHLQKNPDAMAAIGLTLAEISNLVKKVSPSVLLNLRTAAPAVFSLLAHPQFLIAAGVATGVTIIAFGGYKIVKRIQERREMESLGDEALLPVEDVSRIETWRRGIADAESRSVGTSVDGEFITPLARNLSRMNLAEDIRERELERAEMERSRQRQKDKDLRRKATLKDDDQRKSRSKAPRSVTSSQSTRSHRSKRSSSEPRAPKTKMSSSSSLKTSGTKPKRATTKKQEFKPSPLRRLLLT